VLSSIPGCEHMSVQERLFSDIWSKDVADINWCLEHGADVNSGSDLDESLVPLWEAVKDDDVRSVEFLLDHGANPFHSDNPQLSPDQRTRSPELIAVIKEAEVRWLATHSGKRE